MASGTPTTEINGINLEDYLPCRRAYNSVAYVHKKFFNDSSEEVPVVSEIINNDEPKPKSRKKKSKNNTTKQDKITKTDRDIEQTSVNNDEVLGQTIRFAKNIVPIVIPPNNNDTSPVYYTIKTSRKSRVRNSQPKHSAENQEKDPLTYKKQQERKIIETFRKEKFRSHTESCSRASTSRSSIENIVISQSLNSTISEISEKRVRKSHHFDKRCNKTQIAASESLEALATELLQSTGEAKIKIHLMDDTAKDLFYESIRKPVIEAIKESVAEVINSKEYSESKVVHKYVQCHTEKLDNILDKLACIEKRLDSAEEKAKPRKVKCKPSALEEIGEDMSDEKEDDSQNDVAVVYSAADKQKSRYSSAAARLNPLQKIEEVSTCSGDGDEVSHKVIPAVMTERPNRIPTRYCWTDSTSK